MDRRDAATVGVAHGPGEGRSAAGPMECVNSQGSHAAANFDIQDDLPGGLFVNPFDHVVPF